MRPGLDPPFTDTQYRVWEATATRPLTQAAIGVHSSGLRARDARLSRLWTPERTLRMYRRPQPNAETTEGSGEPDPSAAKLVDLESRRKLPRCGGRRHGRWWHNWRVRAS